MTGLEGKVSAQDPQSKVLNTKGDLFAPEGQRAGVMDKDREVRGRREGKKGDGKGYLSWRTKNCLWIERRFACLLANGSLWVQRET